LATIPRLGTVSSHVKTRRKRTQNQFQITREIKSALQGERLRANQRRQKWEQATERSR
jgi:hypothetical protein